MTAAHSAPRQAPSALLFAPCFCRIGKPCMTCARWLRHYRAVVARRKVRR